MSRNASLKKRQLLIAGSSLALAAMAHPALAQETPDTDTANDDRVLDSVVVTGSRLVRSGETAPIPVTTIGVEELQFSGATDAAEILNELPSVAIGANGSSTAVGNGPTAEAGTSLLNLRNLGLNRTLVVVDGRRHVGSVVGAGGTSTAGNTAVDISSIPTSLIEKIEVSTGGASVSYGADAVSGVVNLILKDDFEGVELEFQGGTSEYDDADNLFFSGTFGKNFDNGRGNVTLNITHETTDAALASNRDFLENVQILSPGAAVGSTADFVSAGPIRYSLASETGSLFATFTGLVTGDLSPTFNFNPDGSVSPGDSGIPVNLIASIGGDGANFYAQNNNPLPESDRTLIDARARYEVSGGLELFGEAKYYNSTAITQNGGLGVANPTAALNVYGDNAFLPQGDPLFDTILATNEALLATDAFFLGLVPIQGIATGADILQAVLGTDAPFVFTFLPTEAGLVGGGDFEREQIRLLWGVEGPTGYKDWNFDIVASYGETKEEFSTLVRHNTRLPLAFDAVIDTTGALGAVGSPVCRSTLEATLANTPLTPDQQACVPINLFGGQSASPEAIAYAYPRGTTEGEISQLYIAGNLTGTAFELPAGDATFATGFEIREETLDARVDSLVGSTNNTNGIPVIPGGGEDTVTEAYLEVFLPIISEQPLINEFNIEGGIRISDYETIGQTTSYRVSGEWSPIEDLRFRAGFAQAVRAPNLGELFQPQVPGRNPIVDPCAVSEAGSGADPALVAANCAADLGALGIDPATFDPIAAQGDFIIGGNPDLTEETAESITLGAVYRPSFVPGLVVTADYFDIEITDAIALPGGLQIINDCYNLPTGQREELCSLFERVPSGPGAGNITNVQTVQQNLEALQTQGVDFEIAYGLDIADIFGGNDLGTWSIRTTGTYLESFVTTPPGTASDDEEAGELGLPEWRVNFQNTYNYGPVTLSWLTRFYSDTVLGNNISSALDIRPLGTGDVFLNDMQLRYAIEETPIADGAELYFGVNNVFNEEPPVASRSEIYGLNLINSGAELNAFGRASALYDPVGRFIYGGVKVRF